MSYYNAELPYSDELFHHGILGQKWGVRRFQNPDGTLTELGKVHYKTESAVNELNEKESKRFQNKMARKALGNIGKIAKRAALKFEAKHLRWAMSDERLKEYTDRLILENAYKRALSEAKKSKGKEFISKVLYTVGDKLVSAGADNLANNIRSKNSIRNKEREAAIEARINSKKAELEKKLENKRNKKKESYKLANLTLKEIKNPKGSTLTNEQIGLRLERVNMLKSLEDLKGTKVDTPFTFNTIKKKP